MSKDVISAYLSLPSGCQWSWLIRLFPIPIRKQTPHLPFHRGMFVCTEYRLPPPLFSFRDRVGCMAQTGLKLFLLPLLTESWDHRLMSPCRAGSGTREHGHCHCHTRCWPFLGFRTIITMGLHFPPPLTGFLCRMGLLFKIYFKFI